METLLSLMVGIGLSAACGFRVFVPLLVVSIASLSGNLHLASGFDWVGTWPALIAFAAATGLEIAAYYVPWLDNLLDSIATPSAVVAGTLITAAMITDMSPFMQWTLAAIAGGGAAGLVQGTTVATRALSTAATGGLTNPVLATVELGGALVTSVMAVVMPLFLGLVLVALLVLLVKRLRGKVPFLAGTHPADGPGQPVAGS